MDNRKIRDNIDNETSSRAHLIFNLIYIGMTHEGSKLKEIHEYKKYTFVDLAGAERVAKIEISPNLYLEAIFINESLEELQRVIKALTSGTKYEDVDFTKNPLTHMISDTLGRDLCKSNLLLLINPSMHDL